VVCANGVNILCRPGTFYPFYRGTLVSMAVSVVEGVHSV